MSETVLDVRNQFPIFDHPLPKGQPVTFLDTAASAQKPQTVIDREREVCERYYANAYRGVYRFGAMVDEELEASREAVRKLLGAESRDELAFTAGATMSLNVIANGWGRRHLQPGDEILLSVLEHHANFVPWQQVVAATGAKLRFIPLTPAGELDLSDPELFNNRTRIVAVTGMSNVLGTLPPLAELSQRAHAVGAILVVDAAQSLPHGPIDVVATGIDFLACSGHKLYGPTGVGILYGRKELLAETDPLIFGGHMIDQVHQDHSTWADPPARFEAGTLPIVQAIALRPALEFMESVGYEAMHAHELELTQAAHAQLAEIPGIQIYGPPPERKGSIVSFTMEGAAAEDIAHLLDRKGVFVRHGHHCTMPLHTWLGVPATVRASFGVYNNLDDVQRLADALRYVRQRLKLDT
ncbi:MAG: SufS family cysteine desulfurase [Planctomycetaceae bacterium]|nr:SufS family cysteine desulfurase [Planctomycetaceae bacterium]